MGESFELSRGVVISKAEIEKHPGTHPVYSSQSVRDGILGHINSYRYDGEYITWTTDGANAGTIFYRQGKFNCTNVCGLAESRSPEICPAFVALMIAQYAKSYVSYVGNPKLMSNVFAQIPFSYPPLPEQRKIASQITAIDKVLNDCKKQLDKAKNLKQGMMSYFFG
jgi:restriction endonuclease S subunit